MGRVGIGAACLRCRHDFLRENNYLIKDNHRKKEQEYDGIGRPEEEQEEQEEQGYLDIALRFRSLVSVNK